MVQFSDKDEHFEELRRKEEEELIKALSIKYGHPYVNLFGVVINTEALRLVPEAESRAAEAAVFARAGTKLSVAFRNPNKPETRALLAKLTERDFILATYMVSSQSLEHAWERYKDITDASASARGVLGITAEEIAQMAADITKTRDVSERIENLREGDNKHNVSMILNALLGGAIALRASDMHVEPEAESTLVRYRLDGVLFDVARIDTHTAELVRARLKLLSGLKLNITDRAQDGRFTIDVGEKEYEIRTAVIPGGYGEAIVMRFLDPGNITVTVEQLGINPFLLAVIYQELKRPNGMIITTGPTGSGKTTALYTFLRMVHTSELKTITIEDPIEYHLPGIVQTQVSDKYSFAAGLRSLLRGDPDVMMVGEIRDSEVAATAMDAALTGHLVFSTLHTNSAAGAFPRLRDLGVDPRTMGSALNLVLGQRLVRVLCSHCKVERALTEAERKRFSTILTGYPQQIDLTSGKVYDAKGCDRCSGSGFKGRVGVYEGIRMTPSVAEVIIMDLRESAILEAARPQQIPTMQQDGIVKVLNGTTSLEELERVVDLYKEEVALGTQENAA
jgi:type IV pilus assembly protein PilB